MITCPDILVRKIYKVRYFHNTDITTAGLRYKPSACWRSLCKAMKVAKVGLVADSKGVVSWLPSKSGNFEVSSAYQLALQLKNNLIGEEAESYDKRLVQSFWRTFWKLSIPRKIKVFGWRGYQHGLRTGQNLYKKGLSESVNYCICGLSIESNVHILVSCSWSLAVWETLNIQGWQYLWFSRNLVKHGARLIWATEAANGIRILANQYYFYNSSRIADIDNLRCSVFEWNKPPIGFIKLNCDAAWDEDAKAGGLGIIARDSDDLIMGIHTLMVYHCHISWECEGLALLEALRMGERQIRREANSLADRVAKHSL
ncbi:hypothetical protein QQ045_028607 [Rhodiola kirilowii]